jgi:SAM-dependent methyltransferase
MPPSPKTYKDIKWAALRANAMNRKGWKSKGPKEWDGKADSFSKRNKDSAYTSLFLSHLPLENSLTVLDIGSGPGTLAIPIATRVKSVTAIDFSRGMLSTLNTVAAEQQINNIATIQCAWEDDWAAKEIKPHDIAIASRSMGVGDLAAALHKINSYAKKYVFISDRIGDTPFEKSAFTALGRSFEPGPDYIYTLNTLYTLEIHPNVTVLQLNRDTVYTDMAEAVDSYSWMFKAITPEETILLEKYICSRIVSSENGRIVVRRDNPARWALIWWEK